ncbi:hypothetical protein KOW79_000734 [Hemibagrus wyckioides]|uniref:Uncharacterized protein n=1 Tax=Hemibagrus wyckioides TaxID=337641 RepID=A0A9D3P7I4_9TELE|nr:hypothetical protein KOW79_000734 [Hemibagrus wyckioides]
MPSQSEQRVRNTIVQREKDKTEGAEKRTGKLAHMERIRKVSYRPEFEEASQTGFAKALLRQELVRQRETKLAHVALILVRREALRRVLEEERQLYAKEFSQKGLAIFQQRI